MRIRKIDFSQQTLFNESELKFFNDYNNHQAAPIFILGSPRTGSTFLYQQLISIFNLTFINNLTNYHFYKQPILGFAISQFFEGKNNIKMTSFFGKIEGALQPSEGSNLLKNWCGGGHPSEIKSRKIKNKKISHMQRSINSIESLTQKKLIIKNAWNCFRIRSLSENIPGARFIWIRRDIIQSAFSEFLARKILGGNDGGWSSATPRNYLELKKFQLWKQTLENQYEYTRAIKSGFKTIKDENKIELWYEDYCSNPTKLTDLISEKFNLSKKITNIDKFAIHPKPKLKNSHENLKKMIERTALSGKKYSNLIYRK